MCLQKWRNCSSKSFHRNWVSLVTLQLPSGCVIFFWTYESEKKCYEICTNLPKRKKISPENVHKMSHRWTISNKNRFQVTYCSSNIFFNFHLLKEVTSFQLPFVPAEKNVPCINVGYHLYHYGRHLIFKSSSEQTNPITNILLLSEETESF